LEFGVSIARDKKVQSESARERVCIRGEERERERARECIESIDFIDCIDCIEGIEPH